MSFQRFNSIIGGCSPIIFFSSGRCSVKMAAFCGTVERIFFFKRLIDLLEEITTVHQFMESL
jgi:hypothetical protein